MPSAGGHGRRRHGGEGRHGCGTPRSRPAVSRSNRPEMDIAHTMRQPCIYVRNGRAVEERYRTLRKLTVKSLELRFTPPTAERLHDAIRGPLRRLRVS